MSSHARLSPSSAKRWGTCPASVAREATLPDSSGPAADWGTASHAVLEKALLSMTRPDPNLYCQEYEDLEPAAQKVASCAELIATAAAAYDYAITEQHSRMPCDVRAEGKVDPGLAIGRQDCTGTADIILVSQEIIEIVDLKGGKGVVVEATDPQLALYALGVLMEYGGPAAPFSIVRCTVVQPRARHEAGAIRHVDYTVAGLFEWANTWFANAAIRTDDVNALAVPSDDGCRFCKAKGTCPELTQHCLSAAQGVFGQVADAASAAEAGTIVSNQENLAPALTRAPSELTGAEIQYILDNEKLLTGWLGAVRTYAAEQVKLGSNGKPIPGYKMVAGRGSRSWAEKDETKLKKAVSNLQTSDGKKRLGLSALVTTGVMSPAQAETNIKPRVPKSTWDKIDAMIHKASGAPSLAPLTDPRPAILFDAKQICSPIDTDEPEAAAGPDLSFLD